MDDQLKNIPTIVLSELPTSEKEKYFKFLLENDVQFVEDQQGYYTAIIKVVNSKGEKYSDQANLLKTDKSRLFESTFSSKQKMVITESPRSTSPSIMNRSLNKSIRSNNSRSPIPRAKSPNDYSPGRVKGISDLLDEDRLSTAKSNPTLNTSRSSTRTPEKNRPDPLKLFIQTTKFKDFLGILNVQPSAHLRPKTLSLTALIKTVEEIYSARYKKEIEEKSKKNEEILNNFNGFVAEFFVEKFKNKRMIDQSALDFCQSIETYDSECLEIRIFSNFLTNENNSEVLIFFLYARHTCINILGLQLVPKFAGQKVQDSRSIILTFKQCSKVAASVYCEEESLQKAFLAELESEFNTDSIKLYEFLSVFIESFKLSLQENTQSIAPFTAEHHFEPFGDSMSNTESEMLKSVESSGFLSNHKTAKDSVGDLRPLPKGPFDKIRVLCIEHSNRVLVRQFVKIILSGYLNDSSKSKDHLFNEVETMISEKMTGLIEALCRCDKRKWLEILETDNKEALKHCENLQKHLREIQKKSPEPLHDDIDLICKEILQTSELKLLIGEKLRKLCG